MSYISFLYLCYIFQYILVLFAIKLIKYNYKYFLRPKKVLILLNNNYKIMQIKDNIIKYIQEYFNLKESKCKEFNSYIY